MFLHFDGDCPTKDQAGACKKAALMDKQGPLA